MLENNATYIGSSAGAMLAGIDVCLALDFDRDTEDLDDYRALSLFNGTVIPHYSKADLRRYIKNTDSDVLAGYDKIYSVNDNEALIGEFEKIEMLIFRDFLLPDDLLLNNCGTVKCSSTVYWRKRPIF
ncbi:MAG: Type 1 glutamine amidotransferase-like domain-containing protein [Blautia massiliensis (ex Durand et al. 2017)]|uniref:Type 1 glutamine amidotransferase-like domain-containing protein n=1 Tax=Blautia massiliensis (ex Durand et al. 2017) TaxID=1737424 RepID=UPI003996726B